MAALFGASLIDKKKRKKKEDEQMKAIMKHNAEIAAQKEKVEDITRFNRKLKEAKAGVERAKTNYEKRHDEDWLDIQHEYEAEVLMYEAELERLAS